jgi:hypothetical protein
VFHPIEEDLRIHRKTAVPAEREGVDRPVGDRGKGALRETI